MPLAFLHSPSRDAWHLGPVPLRAQALAIAAGILIAIVIADARYRRAGGRPGVIADVAAWAVPAGLIPAAIGALTAQAHSQPWRDVHIADAVLGLPGAVALGILAAWLACRRLRVPYQGLPVRPPAAPAEGAADTAGGAADTAEGAAALTGQSTARVAPRGTGGRRIRLRPVLGAAAPAIAFGYAVAEIGSWFAQQGFGRPSSLPWAVAISPALRPTGYENFATFTPVFLYQAIWDVTAGIGVMIAARRFGLTGDRVFALGAAAYSAAGFGLFWLGIGHLPMIFGLRAGELGDATVFVAAVVYLARTRRTRTRAAQVSHRAALERDTSVL